MFSRKQHVSVKMRDHAKGFLQVNPNVDCLFVITWIASIVVSLSVTRIVNQESKVIGHNAKENTTYHHHELRLHSLFATTSSDILTNHHLLPVCQMLSSISCQAITWGQWNLRIDYTSRMKIHININVLIVKTYISYVQSYLCKCMYTWHSWHILVGLCWIILPESPTILSNTSTERTLCIGYGIILPQKKTCKTPGSVQCPIAINYLDWKNRYVIVITATAFTTVQSNKLKNKSIGFNQLGVSCAKNHSHPSSAIIPLGSLLAKLFSATSNERKAQLSTGHWNSSWKWSVSLQCYPQHFYDAKKTLQKKTHTMCGINSTTIQQWPFQAPNKEKRTGKHTNTHMIHFPFASWLPFQSFHFFLP